MTVADRIRIAVAQTDVTTDPERNGAAVRAAMRQAAAGGARLIHLAEGALSGYAGAAKAHYAGWDLHDQARVGQRQAAGQKQAGEGQADCHQGGEHGQPAA